MKTLYHDSYTDEGTKDLDKRKIDIGKMILRSIG